MYNTLKKLIGPVFILCITALMIPAAAAGSETSIVLSDSGVTVNGEAVSENNSSAVYMSKKTETHEDITEELKDVENTVITITEAGTYRISGSMTDAQIAVEAGENDSVELILDGVDITCRTAPAILVYSAYEPAEAGNAGVTLTLADGSENTLTGSHTLATEEDEIKHDGAVSSNVSLAIDGSGLLNIIGDTEGIEVKYKHLTINDGTIHIESRDDPLNGSEDYVAHIMINGGYLYCHAVGDEGDGIDSNGYMTINGGTVIALASTQSMDSGLDSELGTTINGGTVIGAGNMFDELSAGSQQLYMFLQFTEATDDLICVTDTNNEPVFAYDFPFSYSYISFSSPQLAEETYYVYIGGTIQGDEQDGLYIDISSYSAGAQLHHGGTSVNNGRPEGMMGGGMQRPEGDMNFPEGMEPPEGTARPDGGMNIPMGTARPDGGMNFPEGMEPPDGMMGGGMRGPQGMSSSSETETYEFVLTSESGSFTNVSSAEIAVLPFEDVTQDAWFYDVVAEAYDAGLIVGKTDTLFMPEDTVTAAELITMLYRADGGETAETSDGSWYAAAQAWGEESSIIGGGGWSFAAESALTREQMMDMMYRFLTYENVPLSNTDDLSAYADGSKVSDYAREAAEKLIAAGIIEGDEAGLRPSDTLTRAETAAILVRALNMISSAYIG